MHSSRIPNLNWHFIIQRLGRTDKLYEPSCREDYEVSGVDMNTNTEVGIKSWSHAMTESKKTPKDKTDKKRSKKRSSKVRRRRSKRRSSVDVDGLDEKDKEFLAS